VHRSVAIALTFVLCANVSAASAIHSATIDRDPFGYREADGTPQGLSVDIYRLVAARLGRTVEVEFANAAQITTGILQGHIDLAVMFEHPELDPAAVAVGPVLEVPTGVPGPTMKGNSAGASSSLVPETVVGVRVKRLKGVSVGAGVLLGAGVSVRVGSRVGAGVQVAGKTYWEVAVAVGKEMVAGRVGGGNRFS